MRFVLTIFLLIFILFKSHFVVVFMLIIHILKYNKDIKCLTTSFTLKTFILSSVQLT